MLQGGNESRSSLGVHSPGISRQIGNAQPPPRSGHRRWVRPNALDTLGRDSAPIRVAEQVSDGQISWPTPLVAHRSVPNAISDGAYLGPGVITSADGIVPRFRIAAPALVAALTAGARPRGRHVQFDERRVKTEPWLTSKAPPDERWKQICSAYRHRATSRQLSEMNILFQM
jgi:hypothetical protein